MKVLGKMSPFRIIGLVFLLIALVANQWTLAAFLRAREIIVYPLYMAFVWTFQGICVVLGLVFFKYGPIFRQKKKTVVFSLMALAIGLVIGLILAEIGVRWFCPGYLPPDVVGSMSVEYVPCVFARHVFAAKEVPVLDINEKGYRGPDFEAAKPEGVIRIMFYGGSQMYDIRAARGEDWPRRVESMLRETGFPNVEVINAGIPEHASFDCVGRLFAEGHTFSPDYVLLCNAWNDIKRFRDSKPLSRVIQPYRPSEDPRTHYTGGVDRFLCHHLHLWVVLRTWYYNETLRVGTEGRKPVGQYVSEIKEGPVRQYRLSIEMFVDCARNIGAVPILIKQPRLVARDNSEQQRKRIKYKYQRLTHEALCEAFERTDQVIDEVADAKGVSVIDASARMTRGDEWFADHIHLAAEGSEELARITAEHIAEVLEKSQ